MVKGKKVNIHPRTVYEGPECKKKGVAVQRHIPASSHQ